MPAVTDHSLKSSKMAMQISAFDWSSTAMGPMSEWSTGLLTAMDLCLGSRLCSAIYWGEEHLVLYNDAYSELLGSKHPWALGHTAEEVWSEVFSVIGPLMKHTRVSGEATGADDAAIFLNRSGYVEEFYCSFSYSPLINEFGDIEGVFTMFPETTARVIGERRLRTVQQLGSRTREPRRAHDVLRISAQVFERNKHDIPFSALYLWDDNRTQATLSASSNTLSNGDCLPAKIETSGVSGLSKLVSQSEIRSTALASAIASDRGVPCGAWSLAPERILFLPFEPYGENAPKAFMLCGVNPHKRLDEDHLSFFRMLADQVTGALAEAFSHEQEDVRLRDMQERARTAQQEERVRIARDLHDTLLQSIQGMRFLLDAALERFNSGDSSALGLFERARDASIQAIDEGRAVLSLLRSTAPTSSDLISAVTTLGAEVVGETDLNFELVVNGRARIVKALVRNEISGICREALTNATIHSKGTEVSLELVFGRHLDIRITDNGCGIAPEVVELGRPGHFGLPGMRERAEKIGASLSIASGINTGTSTRLSVPGDLAYAYEPART
jgi:signal transduction histidine kinase